MPTQQGSTAPIRPSEEAPHGARIKVVGVGGGGSNAIDRMIDFGLEGVEFIALNTDIQALEVSKAQVRGQIGSRLTNGLSAGSDPDVGRRAAIEDAGQIAEALEGADMVFITAGLGGGTGTGAAPVIAAIASEIGALTVAIVTRPFGFEGKRRMAIADWGIHHLLNYVDTLIVIPNEKLLAIARDAPFFESFKIADDFLRQAVQGISDIITTAGVINRDFADVKTTMAGMGYAVMGTASRSGPDRAMEAVMAAMESPLLEAGAIDGARGILINITGSSSLRLSEVNDASSVIQSVAHEDANIIFGAVLDERVGDEVKVTVIASGFVQDGRDRSERRARMLRGAGRGPIAEAPAMASTPAEEQPVEEQTVEQAVVEEHAIAAAPVVEEQLAAEALAAEALVEDQLDVEPVDEARVDEARVDEARVDEAVLHQPILHETIVEPVHEPAIHEPIHSELEVPQTIETPNTIVPLIVAAPVIAPPIPAAVPMFEMEPPAAESPSEEPQELQTEAAAELEEVVPKADDDRRIVRFEAEEEVVVEESSALSFSDAYEADEPQQEFGDEDWKDVIRELARLTEPDLEFDGLSDNMTIESAGARRDEAPRRDASMPFDEPAPKLAYTAMAIRDRSSSVVPVKTLEPPTISNVRQAAIAAYAAVSNSEDEPEPLRPQPSNAFAEVLEARRRFVESMNKASSIAHAEAAPVSTAATAKAAKVIAATPAFDSIEDAQPDAVAKFPQHVEAFDFQEIDVQETDAEEIDEAATVHLSSNASVPPAAAKAPSERKPMDEFFDSPLFGENVANGESSHEFASIDDLPRRLPDFKRRLVRETVSADKLDFPESSPDPEPRVPSFATVSENEADADDLDIPAFLRRGR